MILPVKQIHLPLEEEGVFFAGLLDKLKQPNKPNNTDNPAQIIRPAPPRKMKNGKQFKMNNTKHNNTKYNDKRIAIMGGTFDPVHLGHMSFAQDVLEQTDAEEIVFMPAKLQPFKLDVKMSSFEDRYNMLQLACEALNSEFQNSIKPNPEMSSETDFGSNSNMRASVSSLENELEGVSYTYRTLEEFRTRYMEGGKLYFVTGADTFVKLDTWKESERLLAENAFIVGVRPGYLDGEIYEKKTEYEDKYGTEVHVIMNTPVDLSATEIRCKAAAGEPLDSMVTDKVAEYISKHRLYSLT